MFEINQYNTKDNVFWVKMMDTKASIILTAIDDVLDVRVFNDETIYHKDFPLNGEDIQFKGELSLDGNEFDIDMVSNKQIKNLNLYYNLNNALVISTRDDGKLREITTIPEMLLI